MKQNRFPAGWDEKCVRKVLEHYESQSEDEAIRAGSETAVYPPRVSAGRWVMTQNGIIRAEAGVVKC